MGENVGVFKSSAHGVSIPEKRSARERGYNAKCLLHPFSLSHHSTTFYRNPLPGRPRFYHWTLIVVNSPVQFLFSSKA